jgi:hypothetical protein
MPDLPVELAVGVLQPKRGGVADAAGLDEAIGSGVRADELSRHDEVAFAVEDVVRQAAEAEVAADRGVAMGREEAGIAAAAESDASGEGILADAHDRTRVVRGAGASTGNPSLHG